MRLADAIIVAYEIERLVFRVALVAMVGKLLSEAVGAWRALRRPSITPPCDVWPLVTVQLPVRDEFYVVERVIRAAAALDYPAFEIQVLDDSNDETRGVIDAVVAELRAAGTEISVVRRDQSTGGKGGALAHGTATARGEYIAIFDADFVPERDFLRRVIPHFAGDSHIGMVQGRWLSRDRDRSVLARVQALVIDGLMLVEQPAKDARRQPLHFNGTAGVWRRACIADAGGWSAASITEDLDLSYRAARRGWRMVHLPELAVPTELPRSMRAYRAQQKRWTRGNAQVLRATWSELLGSRLPLRHRLAMTLRACSRTLYVFLAILTVAMPLTTFGAVRWFVDYKLAYDAAVFGIVVAALYAFYLPALQRATGSWWRGVVLVPMVMALHIGLSMCCATAFIAGLVRRSAEFVRTPKLGSGPGPAYRTPRDPFALVELVVAAAYAGFVIMALHRHMIPFAAFFAFWGLAHLWTGAATLRRG